MSDRVNGDYPAGVTGAESEFEPVTTWECDECGTIYHESKHYIGLEKSVRLCHECVIGAVKNALPGAELSDIAWEIQREMDEEKELEENEI